MIRWTGLAPWEFEFPFPGSLTSTFLKELRMGHGSNGGGESGEGLSLWGPVESYRDAPRSRKMTAPELTARSLPE